MKELWTFAAMSSIDNRMFTDYELWLHAYTYVT